MESKTNNFIENLLKIKKYNNKFYKNVIKHKKVLKKVW